MKKILVTGSTGYLAAGLIRRLSAQTCHVVRLSRPGSIFPALSSELEHNDIQGDLQDPAVWEASLSGVDVVFHFAAQTSVATAEENPAADWRASVLPVLLMLETCRRQQKRPTVLMAGTATTIGLPEVSNVNESMPDHPVTVYDLHKLMAEQYVKYAARQKIIRGAILRLFNVYGPGPASRVESRGILNQMVRKALNGQDLPLYGEGQVLRDYIYIDDVADAFLKVSEHMEALNGGHFYVGTGRGTLLAETFRLVAQRCSAKTGRTVSVKSVASPAMLSSIEQRSYVADSRTLSKATGWKPTVTLEDGIDRTIRFFQNT